MKTSKQILDREFLELRSKLLDLAASLDRIDRAAGSVLDDERMQLLAQGIAILAKAAPDRSALDRSALDSSALAPSALNRAKQIQHLFSRGYDPRWKQQFNMPARS